VCVCVIMCTEFREWVWQAEQVFILAENVDADAEGVPRRLHLVRRRIHTKLCHTRNNWKTQAVLSTRTPAGSSLDDRVNVTSDLLTSRSLHAYSDCRAEYVCKVWRR